MMQVRQWIGALALAGLVVAGCGGDDDAPAGDGAPAVDTTNPGTGASDDGSSDLEEERQIAEAAMLRLEDFPTGWEEQPSEDDESMADGEKEIAECLGVDVDLIYPELGTAESATFASPDDETVLSGATVRATEEETVAATELQQSDEGIRCISEVAADFIKEQAEGGDEEVAIGEVSINRMSFPQYGDASAAFRVTVPAETDVFDFEVYLDIVSVRVGRGSVTVQAVGLLTPFDSSGLQGYVQLVTDRLRAALS